MAIKQVEFRGVTRFVALNLYCAHLGACARLLDAAQRTLQRLTALHNAQVSGPSLTPKSAACLQQA